MSPFSFSSEEKEKALQRKKKEPLEPSEMKE